jgi:hypothetical protein
MSRYFNAYHSLKPRRGLVGMVIVAVVIAALAVSLAAAFWLVPLINRTQGQNNATPVTDNPGENNQETEPAELSAPVGLELDSTMTRLSWQCEDSTYAIGYCVQINGIETNVYTNPVTVNLMEGVQSVIRVKARGNNKQYKDSPWSEELIVTKEDGLRIAYQTILSSMSGILNTKVRYGTQPIQVGDIFAIDALDNNTAAVWYLFTCGAELGLARSTMRVPTLTNIIGYKNRIDQITAVINDNDITTEFMPLIHQDATQAMLTSTGLTGSLNVLKLQGYTLTPVCSYTSGAVVAGGTATITLRGILRAEKGSTVRFFSYHYSAGMNEVEGFDSENYIQQMYASGESAAFIEASPAVEISVLGKEMLSIYLAEKEI